MKPRQWYQARIRWAEMVEGRGIRHWEEGLYLYRSEDREAAFGRALEIGDGGQGGGEEENGRRTRWVETRLAEVVTSALAKNDPFVLAKIDPRQEHDLPPGKDTEPAATRFSFS